MTRFDIPECAIETFEHIHNLNVTIHDLVGNLTPFLKPYRFYHRSPLCLSVKAQGHHLSCFDLELNKLPKDLAQVPEGQFHVCHAGLVEWVVPVFEENKLQWLIFAGPRTPNKDLSSAVRYQLTLWSKYPWMKKNLPLPVSQEESSLILEHLRQLASRLYLWKQEFALILEHTSCDHSPNILSTRQAIIHRFIEEKYPLPITLPILAKKLSLSESRASHVIHECCGVSFKELLIKKRLSVATELLRQSRMSVLEVAINSGFDDITHFHRLFRQRIGTTPAQYRTQGQS